MTKSNHFIYYSVINYVSSVWVDCYVRQMNISIILEGRRSMRNDTISFEMYQRAKFNYTDY